MIRTYEIDLDDRLVEDSGNIFESLGTDIDSAIKIFLTQSILRRGFPFDVTVPPSAVEAEKTDENAAAEESAPETETDETKEDTETKTEDTEAAGEEDEDETAPENLFAQWESVNGKQK